MDNAEIENEELKKQIETLKDKASERYDDGCMETSAKLHELFQQQKELFEVIIEKKEQMYLKQI